MIDNLLHKSSNELSTLRVYIHSLTHSILNRHFSLSMVGWSAAPGRFWKALRKWPDNWSILKQFLHAFESFLNMRLRPEAEVHVMLNIIYSSLLQSSYFPEGPCNEHLLICVIILYFSGRLENFLAKYNVFLTILFRQLILNFSIRLLLFTLTSNPRAHVLVLPVGQKWVSSNHFKLICDKVVNQAQVVL